MKGNYAKNTKGYPSNPIKSSKKVNLRENLGLAHSLTTWNNTFLTITDFTGNVIVKLSAGALTPKGTLGGQKKSSPFAGLRVGEEVGKLAIKKGILAVDLSFEGYGRAKLGVYKGLKNAGMKVLEVREKNILPHNGCRPPKSRRL